MEYDELNRILGLIPSSSSTTTWTMTLEDFMNDLFWRGTAQAGERDVCEYGPSGQGHKDIDKWKDSSIDFTLEGKQY